MIVNNATALSLQQLWTPNRLEVWTSSVVEAPVRLPPPHPHPTPPPNPPKMAEGDKQQGAGKPSHPNYQNRCPPPLDLSAQLSAFDKASLRKTDTVVTLPDGKQVVEGKDEEGRTITKSISFGSLGYCGSLVEDLQVGEVLPGLIIGE